MSVIAPEPVRPVSVPHPSDDASDAAVVPVQPGRALVRVGMLVGAALVLDAALQGSLAAQAFSVGPLWTAALAAVAMLLLLSAPHVANHALSRGGLHKHVVKGNVAAAIVSAGHHIATGVLISHCLSGADAQSLAVSMIFFAIGFATLLALQWLYRRLTQYSDDQEVRGDNAAAALSFTGVTLAFSLIIGHATWGTFTGWRSSLKAYAISLLLALFLYPVRQLVVKRVLFGLPFSYRGGALDREIAQERNVVAGAVEGLAYVAMAFLATGLL